MDIQLVNNGPKLSENNARCSYIFRALIRTRPPRWTWLKNTTDDWSPLTWRLRHCPFSIAPTQDRFVHQKLSWLCCTCLTSAPSTMTRVVAIFSYIVRCPISHYWLYATLISSLMMMTELQEMQSRTGLLALHSAMHSWRCMLMLN